jgi:3-deoxy-D-manno-octulosonic-acid transferase
LSGEKEDHLDNKEDHLEFEFSISVPDIIGVALKLVTFKEDEMWFEVIFDKCTAHVISARIAERSQQIVDKMTSFDEKLQEYAQNK